MKIAHKIQSLGVIGAGTMAGALIFLPDFGVRSDLVDREQGRMARQVDHTGGRLMTTIDNFVDETRFLASSPEVKAVAQVLQEETARDDRTFVETPAYQNVTLLFGRYLQTKPDLLQIRLASMSGFVRIWSERDADGQVNAINPKNLIAPKKLPIFDQAIKGSHTYLSRAGLREVNGTPAIPAQPVIYAALPIREKGLPLGLLIVTLDFGQSLQKIARMTPGTSGIYITNDRGDFLYHPDPSHAFAVQKDLQFRAQNEFPGLLDSYEKSLIKPPERETVQLNQDTALVTMGRFPVASADRYFAVITRTPKYEIFGSLRERQIRGLIIAVVTSLIILLAGFMATRSVVIPLRKVIHAARRYPWDDSMGLELKGDSEISELADAIRNMSKKFDDQIRSTSRSELASQLEAETNKAIVEMTIDGLVTVDNYGKVLSFNQTAAGIFGRKPSKVIGCRFSTLLPEARRVEFEESIRKKIDTGRTDIQCAGGEEFTIVRPDGSTLPIEMGVSKVKTWQGNILVYTVRDMTLQLESQDQMAKAQIKAEQASRAKSTFLKNLSHELRTPLNDIIGHSELLQDDLQKQKQEKFLDELRPILGASLSLLNLTNQLVDLSRIESGELNKDTQPFNFRAFLVEARKSASSHLRNQNNKLKIKLKNDINRMIQTDREKLRQCMMHLLLTTNANSKNTDIVLSAGIDQRDNVRSVVFAVTDPGFPLSTSSIKNAFDQFYKESEDTTYQGRLGLTIARDLAKHLGGTIIVRRAESRGVHFVVRIPDQSTESEAAA